MRRDLERHALDDLEAEAFDGNVFGGIVRHQPDFADAEVAKDLGAGAVVANVGCKPELGIRFDRVVSLLLQLVGLEFVEKSDASAFLQQIEDDAFFLFRDQFQRAFELIAAIAPVRLKNVAGETRRVHAHEDFLAFGDFTQHERDVLLSGDVALVRVHAELAVRSRQRR